MAELPNMTMTEVAPPPCRSSAACNEPTANALLDGFVRLYVCSQALRRAPHQHYSSKQCRMGPGLQQRRTQHKLQRTLQQQCDWRLFVNLL